MKRLFFVLTVMLAAFCALSCEKYIEFKGEESEPRLTVSALANAGEPLSAYVASSVFFLNSNGPEVFIKNLDVTRGSVRVTVNGASQSISMRYVDSVRVDGALFYACDYVPQPGDHIVLEAEYPGFDPVRAETDVPFPPRFEVKSLQLDEKEGTLDMELRFVDDGTYEKYYFLVPKLEMRYGEGRPVQVAYRFQSDDIVFKNMGVGVFDMYSYLFGDQSLVSYYFSDALIRGKEHTMRIVIPGLQHLEEGQRFLVDLRTVTESLYWFDVSFAQLRNDFGLFTEGVTLYSNVSGGYGVLCAAATTQVEVRF